MPDIGFHFGTHLKQISCEPPALIERNYQWAVADCLDAAVWQLHIHSKNEGHASVGAVEFPVFYETSLNPNSLTV
jgi:hypothetical protein